MSLSTTSAKSWGLQKKGGAKTEKKKPTLAESSAFGDDSDSDSDDSTSDAYKQKQAQQKEAARLRAEQTLRAVQNEEDSDVERGEGDDDKNDYDAHHDALQAERDRAAKRSEEVSNGCERSDDEE